MTTEMMHRRFADRAFTVEGALLNKPLIVRAGAEISVVTSDLESGQGAVRIMLNGQAGFLMADRAILIRSTRR
jgi:hypothetical protein